LESDLAWHRLREVLVLALGVVIGGWPHFKPIVSSLESTMSLSSSIVAILGDQCLHRLFSAVSSACFLTELVAHEISVFSVTVYSLGVLDTRLTASVEIASAKFDAQYDVLRDDAVKKEEQLRDDFGKQLQQLQNQIAEMKRDKGNVVS
jgi:hypothetical protein